VDFFRIKSAGSSNYRGSVFLLPEFTPGVCLLAFLPGEIQSTKYYVRIYQRIMQNKPNSPNVQIYINVYDTKIYTNFIPLAGYKNKPNSNPIKPNLKKAKMNVNLYIIEDYENETAYRPKKTNPIKPCPERIEFTLSVIEGNGPISYRKSEVRCLYFVFRLLYSVLCFLMKPKLLNFPVKNSLTGLCNSVKYPFL